MSAPVLERRPLAQILIYWRPGSREWTWSEEYADLVDDPVTDAVRRRVDAEGIGFMDHLAPVLLGSDGRVWDGHHRIVIAIERGIPHLNVEIAGKATHTGQIHAGPLTGPGWAISRCERCGWRRRSWGWTGRQRRIRAEQRWDEHATDGGQP